MPPLQIAVSVNFSERSLALFCAEPDVEAFLLDWEPGDCPPDSPNLIEVNLRDTRHKTVWVEHLSAQPIDALATLGLAQLLVIPCPQGILHARTPS